MMMFDMFMLVLGPCLICVVFGIVTGELYVFFNYLLPMYAAFLRYVCTTSFAPDKQLSGGLRGLSPFYVLNSAFALLLAVNVIFNYVMCVTTNPGTHDSPMYVPWRSGVAAKATHPLGLHTHRYRRLMEEAREAGYLGSASQKEGVVDENGTLVQRNVQSSGGVGAAGTSPGRAQGSKGSWIDQGAYEWGVCRRTRMPKAPRSHYDHVTRKLVLNMDHYCPWMFNVVGYANYRFFVLFLFYVFLACIYGLLLTALPFLKITHHERRAFRMKFDHSSRAAVSYTFILSLSIGMAVAVLFFWHVYLLLTAQTTIEFYGNQTKKFRARARGQRYRNP